MAHKRLGRLDHLLILGIPLNDEVTLSKNLKVSEFRSFQLGQVGAAHQPERKLEQRHRVLAHDGAHRLCDLGV